MTKKYNKKKGNISLSFEPISKNVNPFDFNLNLEVMMESFTKDEKADDSLLYSSNGNSL